MQSSFALSLNETKKLVELNLEADNVLLITSQPAVGKSSMIKQVAKEKELLLIDLRLTQVQPADLLGFPKIFEEMKADGSIVFKSQYASMDVFPTESTELPINPETGNPYKGFLLFFDELTSADKYIQAASYRLILDRELGNGEKLHPLCRIVAAGNRMQDNAIVNKMGTAIKSRLVHVEMELNRKEFIAYVEEQVQKDLWHPLMLGFLKFRPNLINNFDPKKEVVTFSSPRTLHMLSNLLMNGLLDEPNTKIVLNAVYGSIGEAAGSEFYSFLQVLHELPDINEIVANPKTANIPSNNGAKFAIGAYLSSRINASNVEAIITYIERIEEKDLVVTNYRMLVGKYPELAFNPRVKDSLKGVNSTIYA